MKDVEFVAQLLLLTENGVASQSQDDLDAAYSAKEEEWERQSEVEQEFRDTIQALKGLQEGILANPDTKRLRNQADFYSLYGTVLELQRDNELPKPSTVIERLTAFMVKVGSEDSRSGDKDGRRYYDAARSASNDAAQRRDRIRILKNVILAKQDQGDA